MDAKLREMLIERGAQAIRLESYTVGSQPVNNNDSRRYASAVVDAVLEAIDITPAPMVGETRKEEPSR